jgi:formylglycine-generating enzyme required for sulfatase activity
MDSVLFHPETSMRRALILALGTYGTQGLSSGEREPLIGVLLDLYRDDPDSGIHAAAEWTLRKWGLDDRIRTIDAGMMNLKDRGSRRWYQNGQGQTLALIDGPVEFRIGAPPTETERIAPDEHTAHVTLAHRFAIASKEVTVEQFFRFLKRARIRSDRYHVPASYLDKHSPDPEGPLISPSWYGAAHYCNWLSEQEGLPKDQWCYLPNESGAYAEGMSVPADFLARTGYRLPSEAEWEYACRAGTTTSRCYGHSIDLLGNYACYNDVSKDRAWRCGSLLPNDLGLFDMLGNVFEWCQDPIGARTRGRSVMQHGDSHMAESVTEKNARVLRGGAYNFQPFVVRSAVRDWYAPSTRYTWVGFRVARTHP